MSAPRLRFSIVTPTHRRPRSLLRMLDALSEQTYPAECFEVVVVIDGPDTFDESLAMREYPFRCRIVNQVKCGPAAARNRGLELATEPYVLFLDDDVIPARSLVEQHALAHSEPNLVVIGPLLAADETRPAPWAKWEWTTLSEQYRAMQAGDWTPTPRQFYTGNASVGADHVRAAGGFNQAFTRGEDVELAWRLHDRGLRFVFNPDAAAKHLARRSFSAWLSAAHDYGRTDVMLERIRTGDDLPGWVKREFQGRHRYTRLLTRSVLAQPLLWRALPGCGFAVTVAAQTSGLNAAAMQLCSALFTAAYWRGVAGQLGRERALELTRQDPAPRTAETTA